jgi:hypothetical protein
MVTSEDHLRPAGRQDPHFPAWARRQSGLPRGHGFRSLLAPLITLVPAFMAVAISGPLAAETAHAGLKVSQLAQLMLIVLVLGAGTD